MVRINFEETPPAFFIIYTLFVGEKFVAHLQFVTGYYVKLNAENMLASCAYVHVLVWEYYFHVCDCMKRYSLVNMCVQGSGE